MYFLVTESPMLTAPGTYHYVRFDQDGALEWIMKHHSDRTLRIVSTRPNVPPRPDVVTAIAQEIDRFLKPEAQCVEHLGAEDEILVVIAQRANYPGNQSVCTVDQMEFFLLKGHPETPTE